MKAPKKRKVHKMSNVNLDNAITLLASSVADSITASEAAIAKLADGGVTPAQVQVITDATTALTAETAKIVAANV